MVLLLIGRASVSGAPGEAPPPKPPEITLKEVPAGRFVFLEHTGPYWTIGPLFTAVDAEKKVRRQAGPMYVRYASDPADSPSQSLRSQVGFRMDGEGSCNPPFRSEPVEAQQVASMTVEGPYGSTMQFIPALRAWIRQKDLEPAGGVIELYPGELSGRKRGPLRVELQMPVRNVAKETPEAAVAEEHESTGTNALSSPSTSPPEPQERVSPQASFDELFAECRFEELAILMLPADQSFRAEFDVWFGQVVFRVAAVAKGLQHLHPEEATGAVQLADALMSRYRARSGDASSKALNQAVVRVDPAGDPNAAQKRLIMRELDTLLGRVATRVVTPPAAMQELQPILRKVQELPVVQAP